MDELLLTLLPAAVSLLGLLIQPKPSEITIFSCPPLVEYTSTQRNKAADEIDANPNAQLSQLAGDYGRLRKACRSLAKKD